MGRQYTPWTDDLLFCVGHLPNLHCSLRSGLVSFCGSHGKGLWTECPILPIFRGGITFSTNRFKSPGLWSERVGKQVKGLVSPILGSVLENGIDSTYSVFTLWAYLQVFSVPIYDGCEKFQLSSYWERPCLGVPSKGSTVMLLFSIKKGALPPGVDKAAGIPANVKFAIYFSILMVMVIAEPTERFSSSLCKEGLEAFGLLTGIKIFLCC